METAFLNALSDTDLLVRVQRLVHGEYRTTAALVAHLAEIENRKLYLRESCASMFVYCTRVLHLPEHAAYHRIAAARLARRFPAVLGGLERGDLHVTALEILAAHLTPENHRELLAAAKHKTKREILEMIAGLHPKPDVAAAIRKLPARPAGIAAGTAAGHRQAPAADTAGIQGDAAGAVGTAAGDAVDASNTSDETNSTRTDGGPFVLTPHGPRKTEIVPLAPERYKIQFTASATTCDKLRRAQELLRHRIPNGDVAAVVDEALDLLVRDLERKKFAATNRLRRPAPDRPQPNVPGTRVPQSGAPAASAQQSNAPATGKSNPAVAVQPRTGTPVGGDFTPPVQKARSRYIPAEIKRLVWQRDQGRCTFMSAGGARCSERSALEFDHIHPYGDGGEATAANVRLLCRAHNQYEAEQFFGVWQASTASRERNSLAPERVAREGQRTD